MILPLEKAWRMFVNHPKFMKLV